MGIIKAIIIAFSTYSILPVPQVDWTEENMRFSLCMLPLVGVPIGGILLFWSWLCSHIGVGSMLFASVAVAIPVLVTGGIHMDGFCDTTDAISSRQEKTRKLEILKDPHVGAFAVIYVFVYLLLCFGCYTQLFSDTAAIQMVCIGFVFSRSLAVWSAITIPNARKNGMLAAFQVHLERRIALTVTACFFLLCAAYMILIHTLTGMVCVLVCGIWFFLYRRMVMRHFGGETGDTTGFFLQMTELMILFSAIIGQIVVRMV